MNKKAKTDVGLILLLVVIVGLLVFMVINQSGQTQIGETEKQALEKDLGDCETAPSISIAAVNAINKGSAVTTGGERARVNGQFIGNIPSALKRGDRIELLINVSNYIDTTIPEFTVDCGTNIVPVELYATDDAAFRIFNTNNALLTNDINGGATNQSSSASPINLLVYIDGKSDQSSGDLIIVIEGSNTTEIDSIKFSGPGVKDADVPEFYAVAGGGSITEAFEVPALIDGESRAYTLTISPESGKTMGTGENGVYVTAYSKQAFVDTDGTFKVGVEDSDGTNKYEDDWDYDFMISA